MFDMQKIGKRIISLRKKRNLTQLELADKMGISFQAISGWERGISMPDISKLPELAQIFNVTIDELIGEKSDFIEAVVNDDVDSYLKSEAFSSDEIADAVPLLKPDQAEQVIEKVGTDIFADISPFLPFMSEHDVKEFAVKAYENGETVAKFLPFMSEDDVNLLAEKAAQNGETVAEFLPFMSENDINRLAERAAQMGKATVDFLPFVSEAYVGQLAIKALEKNEDVSEYLPFMTENDVKKLAILSIKKGKNADAFKPFL